MKEVKMSVLPTCNFCSKPAAYDAPVIGHGSWAYMCEDCYASRGYSGSRLVLRTTDEAAHMERGPEAYDAELEASYVASLDLEELMRESLFDGTITVADGCVVEPDGKCPHGYSSPLLLAGLI